MGEEELRRTFRSEHLSAEEAARDRQLRRSVEEEFPPARPMSPPLPNSISETLKRAIHQSDRPMHEISRTAGVSQNLIAQFLSGERDIPVAAADRLASALGLKLTVG